MTPMERLEWQRKNRQRLYAVIAGLLVVFAALSMLPGVKP